MILRYDKLGVHIPAGDPDPSGAKAVQELMGGRFGEMSTFMNYTIQSFSFRDRDELRPFFDLIANIAAEEFGHIEAVGATITSMLTGASVRDIVEHGLSGHAFSSGKGVLPVGSDGSPWTGTFVFSSGDLVETLTHNFFLECGARNGKLRVYETVDHPAARALTAYLLVRGGVHQVAYARALELLTGADLTKAFRCRASRPTFRVSPLSRAWAASDALPLLAERLQRNAGGVQGCSSRNWRRTPCRRHTPRRFRLARPGAAGRCLRSGLRTRRDRGDRTSTS